MAYAEAPLGAAEIVSDRPPPPPLRGGLGWGPPELMPPISCFLREGERPREPFAALRSVVHQVVFAGRLLIVVVSKPGFRNLALTGRGSERHARDDD